jgi:type I restriction enzyme S subunit
MLLIAPNHIESATGKLLLKETAAEQGAESGKYLCRAGEVIYSKIRPALAKVTIAPEDCLCSADMYPLAGSQRYENHYICWLFLSQQFTAWSVLESDRVAMPKINRDTLSELRMPVPPLTEQRAIAVYLGQETKKIKRMVAKVEEAIERLQEYRSALITAAVTGKIDVRNVRHFGESLPRT